MAASNVDKLRKKKSNFSTTLSSGINDSDATIPLSSASGLATDTAITLTIDRVDGNSVSTPTLVERLTGVISGNNLTVALRGEDGSSAQAHDAGAVVEDIWDADTWNEAVDAILAEHSQAGAHTVDVISEKTAATGVTIDGVKLKDSEPYADAINEKTGGAGVTVDGVLLKDSEVTTDVINEKTGATGVTIDSLLIKDGDIPNARLSSKVITATRDLAAAAGDVAHTGVGFKPTSIICLASIATTQIANWGFADSAKTASGIARRTATGAFEANSSFFIVALPVDSSNYQTAIVKSYDADGFTLTWTKTGSPTGTMDLIFLCFR